MKKTINLILAAMLVVFVSSMAKAQLTYTNALSGGFLIYSNSSAGLGAVDISGTAPTYINPAAPTFGGSLSATFLVVSNSFTNGYYAYQNGTLGPKLDSVLLPLALTNGYIYNFSATLTYLVTPPAGGWGGIGFATNYPTFNLADPRISVQGGNPWTLLNMFANGGGTIFEVSGAGVSDLGSGFNTVGNLMTQLNTPYVINMVVDTTTTNWVAAEYVTGTFINAYTYTTHPKLTSFGYTQTTTTGGAFQWGPLTMSAVPLAITENPATANVSEGTAFTNTVIAGGQTPFGYQWYTNGVAIGNATNASLIFNPVADSNASSDYYCVVTNTYGAVTSAPASLVVYTAPVITSANPITHTNLMTLFGGSGANLGSSPTFTVAAGGLAPLTYYWVTNGVGAAVTSLGGFNAFTFTNCQMAGPTNFSCIVSNSLGTATNTWLAQYIPTPTAPYPQMIISNNPVAYWRLDETNIDPNQYNDGEICDDFMSGNNGVYTNVELYQPGYYVNTPSGPVTNDPTETSCDFGPTDFTTGDNANSMGTNIDFSANSNAEFTVSCWVNGGYLNSSAEPLNGGIVVKGFFGSEEYGLDDGGTGGDIRFFIRTAANAVVGASSTVNVGGNNTWYHIVGVCDESNGVVQLYINGLLTAQTAVTARSGVLPETGAPISIGENLLPGSVDGAHQFDGAIDDVAIFNRPLNALQVDALYQSAGGVNPLTFTAPLPVTNAVWRLGGATGTNGLLTITATALGAPPLGYYWTNITTGTRVTNTGVAGGGAGASAISTITCSLTWTNPSPTFSGDTLELIVTNATGMTNMFFNLFAYPVPITISYTNSILYSNEFDGGTWNLNGTPPTEVNQLVGGTNSTWTDVLGTFDTAGQNGTTPGEIFGSGLDNCVGDPGNSWIFPFTPQPGYVYTETTVVAFSAAPGNWIGEGFGQNYVKNTALARFDDGATSPNGMNWILLQSANGNVEFIDGLDNTFVTNNNGLYTSGAGTNTIVVVLDTTQPHWAQYAWVNNVPMGTNVWASNPTIGSVGITQNGPLTTPNNITWDSWTLSAVAPGNIAPYLIPTLPPTGTLTLTNGGTTTIPATAFGTGPMGYYWINNSTVVASGVTNIPNPTVPNNAAPIAASISLSNTSLVAGTLDLVVTNAYGTNTTVLTLVSPISLTPPPLKSGVTNGILYLSWPVANEGYQLQAQTNSVTKGISSNWANYVPAAGLPSTQTNVMAIPLNLTNGTVFYRLLYSNP